MLKKEIYLVLLAVISFWNLFSQNNSEFEEQLIKYHGTKDTLVGKDLWIYNTVFAKVKKVDLDIFKNSKIETYLVPMTRYLGKNIDEVSCLFTFDPKNNEINFMGEFWCEGFNEEFFKALIGYPLKNRRAVKKFVKDFKKMLETNNPEIRFGHISYDTSRTTLYLTDFNISKEEREIIRILVINYPDGKLTSINSIRPDKSKKVIK